MGDCDAQCRRIVAWIACLLAFYYGFMAGCMATQIIELFS